MGFLVLVAVGAVLGWLGSILSRSDDGPGIALNVAVGLFGALAGGVVFSDESLLVGLSASALLLSMVASIALLGALHLTRARLAR